MDSLKISIFVFISCLVAFVLTSNNPYSRAVVESCSGCQLNRLPEVKAFIFEDVDKYENVVFKHIQGVPPELVLYNQDDEELERIRLVEMNRKECNALLIQKGFKLKENKAKDEI